MLEASPQITDYHAKLFAEELTRKCPAGETESLTGVLMESQVDLNPHQIDAALFAVRSPLSKGCILADEVGLGKTIEAGIVLSQKWAEQKRHILLILPSSLRKQWSQELADKFSLPSLILESRNFNKKIKTGELNPFNIKNKVVICSHDFASKKKDYIQKIPWDLVIIDEAHRLRNVNKTGSNIKAKNIREAIRGCYKLLLTATPLQNSLEELHGLISFIDPQMFGDARIFRKKYINTQDPQNFLFLKNRLKNICKRTLRRQVTPYINYTSRFPYTQDFTPTDKEASLYEDISNYLRRPILWALPTGQRKLIQLILRKLLSSSTFAIAHALHHLSQRLEKKLNLALELRPEPTPDDEEKETDETDFEHVLEDYDGYEEWEEIDEENKNALSKQEITSLKEEISELKTLYERAIAITDNAKGLALLSALKIASTENQQHGGNDKALIFTESKRTQDYLFKLLSAHGYEGKIALFNGSNDSPETRKIYNDWLEQHQGTDLITGSKTADTRAALVDYFKNTAQILLATEAAAEGINLQFCSLVVNYDLPWNPQRIEQRIGRCHRYGQKNDVVVVNFLNRRNAADKRVFELLDQKFKLFSGVFGSSDEILGRIESGIDFEKRIAEIYQNCRDTDSIKQAFDNLQQEMSDEIDAHMQQARATLLENFDETVAEQLRVYKTSSIDFKNKYEKLLWETTQHELTPLAQFCPERLTFSLTSPLPTPDGQTAPVGTYSCTKDQHSNYHYHLHTPLAQKILQQAKAHLCPPAHLNFNYTGNHAILTPLIGKSGYIIVQKLTVSCPEAEDYILCAATLEDGTPLTGEQARTLFNLRATPSIPPFSISPTELDKTQQVYSNERDAKLTEIKERNGKFFDEEYEKLTLWGDDRVDSLKEDLKEKEKRIKELTRDSFLASSPEEKLLLRKKINELKKERNELESQRYTKQEAIENEIEEFLSKTAEKLNQNVSETPLFTLHWSLQ